MNMNWFDKSRNYVVFCFLLFTLGAVTLLGGINKEVPKSYEEKSLIIEKNLKSMRRVVATAKERRAYEAYENRDTKIDAWVEDTGLLIPENAALLYYQAFLLRPSIDKTISQKIYKVIRGAEADRQVRTYLGHCLPMIQTAKNASRIQQCTWGIGYRPGVGIDDKKLLHEVDNLKHIFVADSRISALDGHYSVALENCLTLQRLAHHLINSNVSEIMALSWSVDKTALITTQYILGVMEPNVEIISWFRGQLALNQGVPLSLQKTLQANFKSSLYHFQQMRSSFFITGLRDQLIKRVEDEQDKEKARKLTYEQILSLASEGYQRFFSSVFGISDSEMTYEQKYAQMQRLVDELEKGDMIGQIVKYLMPVCGTDPLANGNYPFQVAHVAHTNGIKAAVEVYLVLAKTGQLPKTLPYGLPNDPFTGKDFIYEITDDGFVLRCQGEDFQERGKRRLEFKVKK
ncbi:MAG: hypothetical protein GY774_40920 [Planctomycetes bacterium]|nr:hypothetical protein [Planctomycetota bacterium]